jgi:hypothetical protein
MLIASPARAGDIQLAVGATGAGTEWRGDAAAYGSLDIGYRFADIVGIYVQGQEGYAAVDQRLLTLVALGVQLWGRLGPTRPYARVAAIHQHEESMSVVAEDPAGALFGVGDGIRHRFGGEAGVGLDVPVYQEKDLSLFVTGEGSVKIFPDDLGPLVYAGAGLGFGMNYHLEELP